MAVDLPGLRLGRELGRGASAVVHEAVTVPGGERVAVKIMTGADRDRVLREARAASAVRHPGIVPVRSVGSSADAVWLVLDLVEGEDLQQRLDRGGPLPVPAAVALVGRIAGAAAALHAAGVVHRDISPANVLLDVDGRVLLTDFGSADPPAPGAPALTGTSEWLGSGGDTPLTGGTWAYMAPEQWRGDPADPRTDVYALGGLLYAALTGQRPHRAGPAEAVPPAAPPRPSDLVPDLSAELDAVVGRAMAEDPADRFRTAAAFGTALAALRTPAGSPGLPALSTPPVLAPPPAPWVRSGPDRTAARNRRRRVVAAVAAGALLATAVSSTVAVLLRESPDVRVVCARDLTVRDRPGGVASGTLYTGARFTVQNTEGAWSYGRADTGEAGWVLSEWLLTGRC